MKKKVEAIEIFLAGVESVKPDNLIRQHIVIQDNELKIDNLSFSLSQVKDIFVTGAGKASALMAHSIENILKDRINSGHVITKYGHGIPLKYISLTEAGHPIPDEKGLAGTAEILALAHKAGEEDLFICLISGGGSALLTDVPEGCTLADIKLLNDILLKCGADISEINCIRKHLSKVKGGQLAKAAFPATIISIILSDVVGDPLDAIASGPTAPDPTTFTDALAIIEKYGIWEKIPSNVINYLLEGQKGHLSETLKKEDPVLQNTHNLVIGSNTLALQEAKEKAESLGYEARVVSHTLQGEVMDVASYLVKLAKKTLTEEWGKKICLLFGGEPTVKIEGTGIGGRNQHLALLVSSMIEHTTEITFLSCGTDGTDGPTDAAGAVIDSDTLAQSVSLGLDIGDYIKSCDSYNFFKQVGGHVTTGPTQTNVMDIVVILIG